MLSSRGSPDGRPRDLHFAAPAFITRSPRRAELPNMNVGSQTLGVIPNRVPNARRPCARWGGNPAAFSRMAVRSGLWTPVASRGDPQPEDLLCSASVGFTRGGVARPRSALWTPAQSHLPPSLDDLHFSLDSVPCCRRPSRRRARFAAPQRHSTRGRLTWCGLRRAARRAYLCDFEKPH
jgi:hypothetical protein